MSFSYLDAILIDLAALTVVIPLLLRFGRLGHSHPATIYLFFHLYSFSWRLAALASGATPLFGEAFWGPWVEALREEELTRASVLADVVLVLMTVAWLWAARRSHRSPAAGASWISTPLDSAIVYGVAAVSVPLGVVGLLNLAQLPGIDNSGTYTALGNWGVSSYFLILQSWAGLGLISLIYLKGFRWWLSALILGYLGIMAFQGFHRYRAIIPSILLVQIYLERRRLRWPNLRMTAVLAAVALAFFPLKGIGRALQQGASFSEVLQLASESTSEVLAGSAPDQTFLDQLAAGLSLIDRADALFLGAPYLAVFTLPVPRQLWPEKPTLSGYMGEISSHSRPMLENGMILTFIGDLYGNFSYVGLLFIAAALAYWLARFYFAGQEASLGSVGHFAYLLLACNLIQVYRDGLVSIVMFTLVNMLPLTLVVVLHLARRRSPHRTIGQPLSSSEP